MTDIPEDEIERAADDIAIAAVMLGQFHGVPYRDACTLIETLVRGGWAPKPQWRNIESAPKDGTYILAWSNIYERPQKVRWDNNFAEGVYNPPVRCWASDDDDGNGHGYSDDAFTVWLPLPSPPTEEQSS